MQDITELLSRWSRGDEQALSELMGRSNGVLRFEALRERLLWASLDAPSLVAVAYSSLTGPQKLLGEYRLRLFRLLAASAREVLVDQAKAGAEIWVTSKRGLHPLAWAPIPILSLEEAMTSLEAKAPELGHVFELRFYGGLDITETAEVLGLWSPEDSWNTTRHAILWRLRKIHAYEHEPSPGIFPVSEIDRPNKFPYGSGQVARVASSPHLGDVAMVPVSSVGEGFVTLYYGTDRAREEPFQEPGYYGRDRGDLERGTCDVVIPKGHAEGVLERPHWWKFEVKENPHKHFVVLGVNPMEAQAFLSRLTQAVQASAQKEAFLFVHGFNTTFAEAAWRTAQLAYDLGFDGVRGLPLMYSWPSKGTLDGYLYDEDSVLLSAKKLERFLSEVVLCTGIDRFHLVAHSMGNRVLTAALVQLGEFVKRFVRGGFNQIILTAPDIDARVFKEMIAPAILGTSERLTLYASSNDRALALSRRLRADYPRAGESGEGLVLLSGMDTIDASEVGTDLSGHSYFAQNPHLIEDLHYLMRLGLPPDQRHLRPKQRQGMKYWAFAKSD